MDTILQQHKMKAYRFFMAGIIGSVGGHILLAVMIVAQWAPPWPGAIPPDQNVLLQSALLWLVVFVLANFAMQLYFYLNKPAPVQAQTQSAQAEFQRKIQSALEQLEEKTLEERWKGFRQFRVARKEAECADQSIVSFYLTPYHPGPLPRFRPGQYLTFRLNIPGQSQPVVRCYSLSDSCHDYYRVSIKRVPAPPDRPELPPGLSSGFFHNAIHEGDLLDVRAPGGHFFLDTQSQAGVVLIAGGVGITPVLSMLNTLVETGSKREIHFFYGVVNSEQHAFKKHLEDVAQIHPNVHLHVCYSQPLANDVEGKDYQHRGRVAVELFKKVLPSSNYQYYICGPGPMMSSVTEGLKSWGVPDKDVHFEAFGPASVPAKKKAAVPAGEQLEVLFKSSGKTLAWTGEHENLLALGITQGLELRSGCRMGNCGACQVALLEGKVEYPAGAPGAEIEDRHCLLCVGVPKGRVVVDA